MSQHDNGRRPGGTQSGAWQQDHRNDQGLGNRQQDQSGGQYGGHDEARPGRGHQDQFDNAQGQQGDGWRDRQGSAAGGSRPAMEERDRAGAADRGGQGSFGGQASDNDYGNRGITESGNFGNYADQGNGNPRGSRQGEYRQGDDARNGAAGGTGGHFGADADYGNSRHRDTGVERDRGRDGGPTWGQSSADHYQGGRSFQAPSSQDRYGDNGYQGNWTQGQRGQSLHDPDYHQWRSEQVSRLDRDYDEWRQHRYQRFSEDFDNWRANRGNDSTRSGGALQTRSSTSGDATGQNGEPAKPDASSGGDKVAGKTASK